MILPAGRRCDVWSCLEPSRIERRERLIAGQPSRSKRSTIAFKEREITGRPEGTGLILPDAVELLDDRVDRLPIVIEKFDSVASDRNLLIPTDCHGCRSIPPAAT
ncbi:hypothetical protein [Curtobacterium sp. RRHDQ10]|uniref:hypothetical protein n=1 Tax=Curtobacterium phyllosphaerae TaxID=3413379 RepID=UPI003BF4F5BD